GAGREPAAAAAPARSTERAGVEREAGPRGWLFPIMEAAYSKLVPRGEAVPTPPPPASLRAAAAVAQAARASEEDGQFRSRYQPGLGEEVLAPLEPNLWLRRLEEY